MKKFLLLLSLVFLGVLITQIKIAPALMNNNDFRISTEAIRSIYQNGVPHTDKMGQRLMKFDPEKSFFPRCIYHALTGNHRGREYSLSPFKSAEFNCVHTWQGQSLESVIGDVRDRDLQLIYMTPNDDEVKKYAKDPNILGWMLEDEPTHRYDESQMAEKLADFQERAQEIKRFGSLHPSFIVDIPLNITKKDSWWRKWSMTGDVSAQDNYPIRTGDIKSLNVIPTSISLAVSLNRQQKPLWFVAQAFAGKNSKGNWVWAMPSERQERGMIYSSIIHGATGVFYFAYDSWITRTGKFQMLGISPEPVNNYIEPKNNRELILSEEKLEQGQVLWDAVANLNEEIEQLKPVIFSPTSRQEYKVYIKGESYSKAPIRSLLKEVDGQFTLLTVNLDKKPLSVKYEFPDRITDLKVLFENEQNLETEDNSWVDSYDDYGVHVYQFRLE
jgi:hypothetical protein